MEGLRRSMGDRMWCRRLVHNWVIVKVQEEFRSGEIGSDYYNETFECC